MLKFFTNLIFIIMLFIFLSGMPMNMEILDINPFQPVVDTSAETDTPVNYTLSDTMTLEHINPKSLDATILSSEGSTIPDAFMSTLSVTLQMSGSDAQSFDLSSFEYQLSSTDDPLKTTLHLNLENIINNLDDGYYTVELTSSYPTNTNTSTSAFTRYTLSHTYLGSTSDEQSGKLSMTLYFPTEDYSNLVPITMRVSYPENRSRTLYKTLYSGPDEGLGLLQGTVIPYASRIYITGGIASVYIYSPEQTGYEDRFGKVIEAITNSMASLGFIDSAKFYIDNRDDVPFGGVDLTQTFLPTTTQKAYIGYAHAGDYLMLLPLDITSLTGSELERDQAILDVLMGKTTLLDDEGDFVPTLPANTSLLDATLDVNGTLTLTFADDFTKALDALPAESQAAQAQLLIDSLTYTFTSLPNVTGISLRTSSVDAITDFYGINTTGILVPPKYINLAP